MNCYCKVTIRPFMDSQIREISMTNKNCAVWEKKCSVIVGWMKFVDVNCVLEGL